jgi:hypothetical protein
MTIPHGQLWRGNITGEGNSRLGACGCEQARSAHGADLRSVSTLRTRWRRTRAGRSVAVRSAGGKDGACAKCLPADGAKGDLLRASNRDCAGPAWDRGALSRRCGDGYREHDIGVTASPYLSVSTPYFYVLTRQEHKVNIGLVDGCGLHECPGADWSQSAWKVRTLVQLRLERLCNRV